MNHSRDFDIVILGGGCIGASILYELTRRGFRSLALIDQGRQTTSATANSGGMLRVFHENPEHVALALAHSRMLELYNRMRVIRSRPEQNGSLYFFNRERLAKFEASLRAMSNASYPFEILTTNQGQERFPEFRWADGEWAIYEPQGGVLDPLSYTQDLLRASLADGVTLIDSFEARRLTSYLEHYRICGENQTITARALVLAGGARMLPRLRDLGLRLTLETRTLTTFHAQSLMETDLKSNSATNPEKSAIRSLPNFFDRETLEFGRLASSRGILLSDPLAGKVRAPFWSAANFTKKVAEDCYAPNRLGIMGQIPGHPRLFIATGWGGTAFKFSHEIGRRTARSIEKDLRERGMSYAQI